MFVMTGRKKTCTSTRKGMYFLYVWFNVLSIILLLGICNIMWRTHVRVYISTFKYACNYHAAKKCSDKVHLHANIEWVYLSKRIMYLIKYAEKFFFNSVWRISRCRWSDILIRLFQMQWCFLPCKQEQLRRNKW